MAIGSEVVAVIDHSKDMWSLVVLALIGTFAILHKHIKPVLSFFKRSDKENAAEVVERRKAQSDLIGSLTGRIAAMEKEHHDCNGAISQLQRDVSDARVHFAGCDAELRIIRLENQKLNNRVSAFEQTLHFIEKRTQGDT